MASLNLSTNGPSISKSYQSVVDASLPTEGASKSSTYGQWAVFSVSAPLANAFQQDTGSKESVLKVQSTGEGELVDLVDEFSDGRIQFAFAKVKDPNTTLPKSVLIGWCGEGVPERTKGYFTSHLAAVSKYLHGYHVQITARSDRDLTPESIVQKVSDASGSKYTGSAPIVTTEAPAPPVSSKPAFTPTLSSRGGGGYNPLSRSLGSTDPNLDEDGWGHDAPPVTRTQLEKVQSSYTPTKVDMRDFRSQKPEQSHSNGSTEAHQSAEDTDVVKGGYQPVGKVDIAALRKQANQERDDRPTTVRGAYEPVGKVDIGAIRSRARKPEDSTTPTRNSTDAPTSGSPSNDNATLPDRTVSQTDSERLRTLPKPKVSSRFGSSSGSFMGTKAPTPSGFGLESKPVPVAPPVGVGRTFADKGGKTPAQLWAEKKASERGLGGQGEKSLPASAAPASPIQAQSSGEWKSGYGGKSWAPVQTSRTGQSADSSDQLRTGDENESHDTTHSSSAGGVGAIRDRFKGGLPIGAANVGSGGSAPSPPPLDTSNKPNAGRGVPVPGIPPPLSQTQSSGGQETSRMPSPPPQPPRSPTPPTPPTIDSGSPIRVAMPVGRGHEVEDARDEQFSPPPAMPTRSLAEAIPLQDDLTDEPLGHDPARAAGEATAVAAFGNEAAETAHPGAHESGKRALVQYDYEKAEDNELELREGEYVINIEMVDEDWWMGQNPRGESGLFPSNYVELVEGGEETAATGAGSEAIPQPTPDLHSTATLEGSQGATATALYDYEAAEENELSFPENAKIINVEFPDEDWWSGEYRGHQGLFPANYVQLDES